MTHQGVPPLPDLCLVRGGPTRRVLARLGLIDSARPSMRKIALLAGAACWLPLLLLVVIEKLVTGGGVIQMFVGDYAAWVRFLIAVPLLILADDQATAIEKMADCFTEDRLVDGPVVEPFMAARAQVDRLSQSWLAELAMALLAYAGACSAVWRLTGNHLESWIGSAADGHAHLTWAGWWLLLFSAPLFQFLMLRWIYRLALLANFFRRVGRLDLRLIPGHPDRVGGLGFLIAILPTFTSVLFALSAVFSAGIANLILYSGGSFMAHKLAIGGFVVIAMMAFVLPLLSFAGPLTRTKRKALLDYGSLGARIARRFDDDWGAGGGKAHGTGTPGPEPSTLCDYGQVLETVQRMRVIPVDKESLITLAIACVLPLLPALALEVPLAEILKEIVRGLA